MRALFWTVFFLLGSAGSGGSLLIATVPAEGIFYLFLLVVNVEAFSRSLHDLVGLGIERRRDAQLTWAICWLARHEPSAGARFRYGVVADLLERHRAQLRVVQ